MRPSFVVDVEDVEPGRVFAVVISCDGLGVAVELVDVSICVGGTSLLLRKAPGELASRCKDNLLWEGPARVAPPGSVPVVSTSIGSVVSVS